MLPMPLLQFPFQIVLQKECQYRNDLSKKFKCKGFINAGNQQYRCFNGNKHGKETLYEAIANSCNTYFINCVNNDTSKTAGLSDVSIFLRRRNITAIAKIQLTP